MNILLLSKSHPEKTAGVIAKDLLNTIKSINGYNTKLIVQPWDKYSDNDIIPIEGKVASYFRNYSYKISNRLKKFFGLKLKVDVNYSLHEFDETITYYNSKKFLRQIDFVPEVIIVLFMPQFLSFKNLYELHVLTGAKILLYPMDNAPYTGGCHWNWDCKGYTKLCGECPALNSKDEFDQSRKNMLFKAKYMEKTELELIAGNSFIKRKLEKSSLFGNRKIHLVPPATDEKMFKPGNRVNARKDLGLPVDKKIVFFGAVSLAGDGQRKGLKELKQALRLLAERIPQDKTVNIHLVQAGSRSLVELSKLPFTFSELEFLDLKKLAKLYQAVDLFICPSIEDAGPLMTMQSILSGTPVVAFEMGVALDLVITGETGYRAKLKDAADLAKGIQQILELNENDFLTMKSKCRDLGLRLCSKNILSDVFTNVFKSISRDAN